MRFRFYSIVVFVLGLAVCASASAQDRLVWVGVTDTDLSAAQTLFGMNGHCADKFPSSRMCTTEEIMYTESLPGGLPTGNTRSYVRPIWSGVTAAGELNDKLFAIEAYTGFPASDEFGSCLHWISTQNTGHAMVLILNEDLAYPGGYEVFVGTQLCSQLGRVACCAPKAKK